LAKRSLARRRHLRKHHPFPRLTFDAAWRTAVDVLINPYWAFIGRGSFILRLSGDVEIKLLDGRVYRGRLRRHITKATPWFVGFVHCQDEAGAQRDERLNAEGALPEPRPSFFDLWPLQVKINPTGKPGSGYVGLLWVTATDGRPGGEVYRVVAGTRDSDVILNGYIMPYRGPRA
jgi:hypothetical protein